MQKRRGDRMREIMISSTVMILLVMLFRVIFRGKVRHCLIYAMWLFVALRLLVPVNIGTFSFGVSGMMNQVQNHTENTKEIETDKMQEGSLNTLVLHKNTTTNSKMTVPEEKETPAQISAQEKLQEAWKAYKDKIWLAGTCSILLVVLAANIFYVHKLKKNRKSFDKFREGKLPVYVTENVQVPCLYGVFKTAIYLPAQRLDKLTEEQVKWIICHEECHYRQGDHIWSLLRILLTAVYWFHPLVWAAAYLSKKDAEISCDEKVLANSNMTQKIAYGKTLICVASRDRKLSVFYPTTAVVGTKKELKNRMRKIVEENKYKRKAKVVLAVIMVTSVVFTFSGCGNVMNCNHPIVRKFIIDCLRYWVINYRVDGFRFDLASILSRDQNGAPMENPPILQGLACDPILAKAKLIAEAWDAGGLYQVGSFPSWSRWAEWNGRYRDDMRRFLKGDGGMAGTAITRITGSRDLYDPAHRGISASVNFLTCHDGFTLYDLYSYNMKHNEKNGWENTDGDNNGNSWNCGAEGATDDPEIEGLRRRMVKNAFATLMCSRGPAMFFAGDEFCNTQFGNNNSYCQDNITSWLDWNRLEEYKEIHDFFRYMIRLRKDNAILRKTTKPAACKLPEISIHNGFPWNGGTDNNSRLIGIMYAGRDENDIRDDIVFYCMNAYWETLIMQLPELPMGMQWKVCVNTFLPYKDGKNVEEQTEFYYKKSLKVPPRTVMILIAEENQ